MNRGRHKIKKIDWESLEINITALKDFIRNTKSFYLLRYAKPNRSLKFIPSEEIIKILDIKNRKDLFNSTNFLRRLYIRTEYYETETNKFLWSTYNYFADSYTLIINKKTRRCKM